VRINKDTKKLFSVASRPGNFGTTIYNELFRQYGINAVYLPCGVDERHTFHEVFHGLRIIGAVGINVSMPFKEQALSHAGNLPRYDAINTLVKDENGFWSGHNTDAVGFYYALKDKVEPTKLESVFILGEGGVAKTVRKLLVESYNIDVTMGKKHPEKNYDLFVNATPIGMPGVPPQFSWDRIVVRSKYVFDAVIPLPGMKTELVQAAQRNNVPVIPGHKMAMYGIASQFTSHFPQVAQQHQNVEHLVKEEMKVMGYEV
jgi:shikimate 5-dehydrogenase